MLDGVGAPLVYFDSFDDVAALQKALEEAEEFHVSARSAGMKSDAFTFGYLPRVTIRRDYCTNSAIAHSNPKLSLGLFALGSQLSALYQEANPELHALQNERLAGVKSCWRMPNSVFTTGIVNRTSALDYHRDRGNFPGLWNVQLAWQRDVAGGNLLVPELNLGFSFEKPAILMMDAQARIHGVSPLKVGVHGYRYSVVFYALKNLCNCEEPAEELNRIRLKRTERERKRRSK